eukprot:3181183-Prymnesium_polylepis.1
MSTQSFVCDVPSTVSALNNQYRRGAPSNTLSEAGIVMRVFDECTDPDEPWELSTKPPCWDHLVVSVINANHPNVYRGDGGGHRLVPGFVFAGSPALQRHLLCSYPRDAGTSQLKRLCEPLIRGGWTNGDKSCVPGCFKPTCDPANQLYWCSWSPEHLQAMLRYQDAQPAGYNEIILDTYHKPFDRLLPGIVVAAFMQHGCSDDEAAWAWSARDGFCEAHDRKPSCIPMLVHDPSSESVPLTLVAEEERGLE